MWFRSFEILIFNYLLIIYGPLAQLAEHAAVNRSVVGSNPTGAAKLPVCRHPTGV